MKTDSTLELTILMPCLNEAETLGICIKRAQKLLADNNIDGEILVADNGSTDGSKKIARDLGVRVVKCSHQGYGAALQCGIEHAKGKFILMGDSDDSYRFDEAMPLIEELRRGKDVCLGTRLKGRIMPGAMPFLNKYLGNPVLTAVGKIFFKVNVSDFHCGMRAFRRDKYLGLNIVTTGMEWASEMVVKSRFGNLNISEIPITLYKDGRSRRPHLKRWHDGWRHLRFMLLHAPTWLFIFPGAIMLALGFVGELALFRGPLPIGGVTLDVHTMLVMAFVFILGLQVLFTGVFATLYSHIVGILPYDERFHRRVSFFTFKKLLVGSSIIGSFGLYGFSYTFFKWYQVDFSALNYQETLRYLIPSLTLITVAIQGVFNGFMLSLLFLKTRTLDPLPI
jgi:glycosyltransferase involved in cell wall biosynthesis